MIFKHVGSIKLNGKGAETAKGNKNSFLGKLFGFGSSSKDENGEAAGTASVVGDFNYEFSAELSVEELQEIYRNNRDNMDQLESDMKKFMSAVTACYNDGKKIVLDVIDESHKNDLADYKRSVEVREARLNSEKEKDELEKKFHPTEEKSE